MRRQRARAALEANPYDLEAQKLIEEEIREANVEANRQDAIEFMPESLNIDILPIIPSWPDSTERTCQDCEADSSLSSSDRKSAMQSVYKQQDDILKYRNRKMRHLPSGKC